MIEPAVNITIQLRDLMLFCIFISIIGAVLTWINISFTSKLTIMTQSLIDIIKERK